MFIKNSFWFFIGTLLGFFFLISFALIIFQIRYKNLIYPGIVAAEANVGGLTKEQAQMLFAEKNQKISQTQFIFVTPDSIATISAKNLEFGYNETLIANQAFSVGRSNNMLSNLSLIFQAYINTISLPSSYHFSSDKLKEKLKPIADTIHIEPVNALFTFENGRVIAFRPSSEGKILDFTSVENTLASKSLAVVTAQKPLTVLVTLPIKTLEPDITTDEVNSLGIKEVIGTGTSLFQGSILGRVYNVTLATSRISGVLVAPSEVFSFAKVLGDVSSFTGYKQAYVIQNGRTVLGDGGGVCQVSTTLFRAILNAGLPIVERHAHAYRVHYYEEDSPPGIDATVYVPSVDLKFKNDTGHYILIQSSIDQENLRLTFWLYGTKDDREVTMTKPVILSQTPPPPPEYQDDPTLPKGKEKQIDFAAWGANVYFTRQVKKNGKVVISETFTSNYQPWKAVYLRGTKE